MGRVVVLEGAGNAEKNKTKKPAAAHGSMPSIADSKSFENAALDISLANLNTSEGSCELRQLAAETSAHASTVEEALATMQSLLQKVEDASSKVHGTS
jgi:hypothetical protein